MTTPTVEEAARVALEALEWLNSCENANLAKDSFAVNSAISTLRTALAAQHPAQGVKGMRMVPVEPDENMLVAGQEAWVCKRRERPAVEDCQEAAAVYSAMLNAAPDEEALRSALKELETP